MGDTAPCGAHCELASAEVFTVLRDPAMFSQARVVLGAVTWPGELDIAPDAMYDEIRARGSWTIAPFEPSDH